MKSEFVILGKTIPSYAFFGIVGIILGLIYLFWQSRSKKQSFDDVVYFYIWSLLFAMLGAKLLYLLIELPSIVKQLSSGSDPLTLLWTYVTGGFVFYGGLLGAILGVRLSCSYFKKQPGVFFPLMLPVLPLVHGFGRIGCYFTGCCHGIQTTGHFSVIYTDSIAAPNNIPLLPVQLMEAIADFILFLILHVLSKRTVLNPYLLDIYLLSYCTVRFVLEFFRGDSVRGSFLLLSTSQWISILLIIVAMIHIIRKKCGTKQAVTT